MTEYGARMGELARALRSEGSSLSTLQHVVTATSEMVKGCDDVAISLARDDGAVETRASLGNGLAEAADRLQQEYGEGPCVDTGWDHPLVRANELPVDGHWPRWSPAVADELGLRSLVCVQLFTHEEHELGALQVFSTRPHAFGDEAAAELLGIAAHAAVALGTVMHHESMQFGLVRRTMIGQATGILMERYGLDARQGFEVLRRTSQETGRKVYDLAIDLVNGKTPAGL
ncbi:GAF and ANTAR domain-containing protein [Marmoricola endophyticus]|nr:GAF and ANTAR domain-containing protein [Marmoricola endophyticus]